jgi:hypothetical protein
MTTGSSFIDSVPREAGEHAVHLADERGDGIRAGEAGEANLPEVVERARPELEAPCELREEDALAPRPSARCAATVSSPTASSAQVRPVSGKKNARSAGRSRAVIVRGFE